MADAENIISKQLAARFDASLVHLAEDTVLLRRGRYCDASILVNIGQTQIHLTIRNGFIEKLEHGTRLMRGWDIAFRAEADIWQQFWQPIPRPGAHDLFALSKRGVMAMEGNIKLFVTNLQYFKDLLARPRLSQGGC